MKTVLCLLAAFALGQPRNLHDIPSDLQVPALSPGDPAPGKRVKQHNPGYEKWDLYHIVYLPPEWKPGGTYPVIVEYAGNGGYMNKLGDRCTGKVEDCSLGYGISGGRGMIWVCLPFVNPTERKYQLQWWGDADATAAYCKQTVARICKDYGGDPSAVILTGFSRGAIACNYIGLRDDDIASLWLAFIPHSHYDGVRKWPYADSDRESAKKRLARLKGRPQFITHEQSVDDVRGYLKEFANQGDFTFVALPFANHSDLWVLKDLPERAQMRQWLKGVLDKRGKKLP